MKKLTTILTFFLLCIFLSTTFYVFDIPPFKQETINQLLNRHKPPKPNEQIDPILTNSNTNQPPTQTTEVTDNEKYNQHLQKGDSFKEEGIFELAIKEYQNAQIAFPKSITPLIRIGKIHMKNNDYETAYKNFALAHQKKSDNVEAQINMGKALIAQRNITQATEVFNSISPSTQETLFYQALLQILNNDHQTAKTFLEEVITLNTNGIITQKAKNFINAYQEFEAFQGSNDAHLKTLLGRAYTQSHEYHLAIPLMFKVIKEKNNYRDAWIILGYSYLKINKPLESIDALTEAYNLDPQKPESTFFLGLAYFKNNDLEKAIEYMELAKKNQFQPQIQVEQKLAEFYSLQEDFQKSAASLEKVLTLNTSDIGIFTKLVWIHLSKLNQPEKALKVALQSLEAHPQKAMSHNLIGWAYTENNQFKQAQEHLQRALEIDPKLDAAHLNFGILHEKNNDTHNARISYKKAFNLGNGNSISQIAAEKYKQLAVSENNNQFTTNLFN